MAHRKYTKRHVTAAKRRKFKGFTGSLYSRTRGVSVRRRPLRSRAVDRRSHKFKFGKRSTQAPLNIDSSSLQNGIDTVVKRINLPGRKIPRALKFTGRFYNIQTQTGFLSKEDLGQQLVEMITAQNTREQFIISSGVNFAWYQAAVAYFKDDPNGLNTGGGMASPYYPAAITDLKNRFVNVLNNHFQIMLTNFMSISTLVDVYLCMSKSDQANDPSGVWQTDLDSQGLGIAGQTFDTTGKLTTTNATIGSESINMPGERPGGSTFHKHWKILAVRRMKLSGGGTEEVTFNVNVNRAVRRDQFDLVTTEYQKNLSLTVMVVARSQLVVSRVGTSAYTRSVGYGGVRLGYAVKNQVTLANLLGQSSIGSRHAYSRSVGGNPNTVADMSQREVNVDDTATQVQDLGKN